MKKVWQVVMSEINKEKILNALKQIFIPGEKKNLLEMGIISSVMVENGKVRIVVETSSENGEKIRKLCEDKIAELEGVNNVIAVLTSEASSTGKTPILSRSQERKIIKDIPPPPTPKSIKGIKHIIAVASGKGGVGKSTVSVNLAVSLAKLGLRVGLADADIHGPSVAHMLNLKNEPGVAGNRMIPPISNGIKVMSMGMLIRENVPVVWRGPMISKALQQLILAADWGELDFLVIDLPPGTGDIHLSIAQNFKLSGAVIVTTPQEVAILDVRKAIEMFRKVGIKILGLVENMSYLEDKEGGRNYIFGKGGATKMAGESGVEVLASLPIEPLLSRLCDEGKVLVSEESTNKTSGLFNEIAVKIKRKLSS